MTALCEEQSFTEKFLWKEVFKFQQKNFMLISNKECASLICVYIKGEKKRKHKTMLEFFWYIPIYIL